MTWDSVGVAQHCSACLWNLSCHDSNRAPLLEAVGLLQLALQRHSEDVLVARHCVGCLNALALCGDSRVPLMAEVPLLRSAMERHASDT
jgi:hypothetical protein